MSWICRRITLCLFVMVSLALGAAPSANKPAPIVIVSQIDGTSLRGHLTASDVDGVTVAPIGKPGAPAPDAVNIAWKQIKTVSNGLTRAKVTYRLEKGARGGFVRDLSRRSHRPMRNLQGHRA